MRVELTTLGLLDPRSNQLSYEGMPKKGARPKKGGMCPPHCSQMTQLTTQAAPTTDSFPAHRELAIEHTNVIIFRYNFLSVRAGIAISTTTETRTEKRRH